MPCGEREECEAASDNNKHIVYGKVDVLGMRQEIASNSDLGQPCRKSRRLPFTRLGKKSEYRKQAKIHALGGCYEQKF